MRGSKGGLQSSAAARCSSIGVAGGAGTELSPAAGLSCRATVTRFARARASSAPLAPGAIEARAPACTRAVLARGTGGAVPLAFLQEPITPLGSPHHPYAVLAAGTVGANRRSLSAVHARGTGLALPFASLQRRRTRLWIAVLACGTVGARTRACSAVLARVTGLARSLGIIPALGLAGGACASQKCNESNWERETGRQVRERRPIRQCDPSQCDLSQHASGRGYCVRASRSVHMTCNSSRCCRGWRAESRLSLKAKASWAPL